MTSEYKVDASKLLEQAGDLRQVAQNISYTCSDLKQYCNQIASSWKSNTEDRESYLRTLQNNLEDLATLVSATWLLADNLQVYAQNSINISSNGK